MTTQRWLGDGHMLEVDISDTDNADYIVTKESGINEAINAIARAIVEKKIVIRDSYVLSIGFRDGEVGFNLKFVGHVITGNPFGELDKDVFATNALFYVLQSIFGRNTEEYKSLGALKDNLISEITK